MKGKKTIQYPNDKFGVKYDNNPPVGKYNVEDALAKTKPRSPAVQIREPLNLYKKPMSIRPEAMSVSKMKKFGDSVHVKVDMGSKYETKIIKYPSPKNMDYDTALRAQKPKVPGGSFGSPQTIAPNQSYQSPGKTLKGSSYKKTPSIKAIKGMTREEKIRLLNQLNGAQANLGVSLTSSKKSIGTQKKPRPTSAMSSGSNFATPQRSKQTKKVRPQSAATMTLPRPAINNFMESPAPAKPKPGPKQEPKSLVALVRPQDQLTHQEAIEYLKRIIDAQKRVGQPGDDVGAIFDKIQIWKQKQGDLDKQEKFVAQALKCKGLAVHNVKTALAKMDELKRDIKLTDDEITIIVYTSLDHGHLPNLLLLAGEFLKWFNLNFEGESTEERDFKDNKEEIWISTCIQASGIIKAYNGMSSNKEQILTQPWWEHQRYSNFGNLLAQRFKAKSHLMKQLRDMFKAQGDKLSYFDLFQFIELTLSIKLSKWEEDDLEGRLDRLGMAFIEFNEFNEFSQEYGIDWNEPLLENDLEDILDAKLNLSYKNYQLTEEDYFHGCPTMLTSEKAALAAVSQIYKQHKAKQKSGKGGKRFVDIDFGPKDANDEVGGAMAMYKTGEVPRKGYPKPANVAWVHADKICPPGKTVQFVDDGVASSDCVQGTLGDCWLISAMSVLATRDELLIGGRRGMELDPDMLVGPEIASLLSKGVYPPIFHRYRDIGLYVIRIFKDMQWVYVIVDDRIPISTVGDAKKKNKPVFGRCKDLNEIWVPVIEKAYAKLHGCYENLISGYVDEGIQELTGFQPEKILIRNEQSGLFPHKMIEQYYGGYKGFWDFLLARDNDGCLLGCSIKGYGKEGPQVIDGQPTGLILNHAYGINDIFEFDDNYNKGQKVRLLRLRNPWGNSEWKGAWSDDSPEVKKYRREIEKYIDSLPPDEQFELGADDGTFLMHYEDWHDNMSTLFLNVDFPEDYTGVRFASKWTKSNSGGLPGVNQQDVKERYATNPQFLIKPAYDTEVMLSLTQTGGRLPREPGQYFDYPFAETLHYAAVGVFKLNKGQSYLPAFDAKALKFMSPIKRERENSGRVILEAGSTYAIVCSTELAGKTGEFFLSVYFNQALRDVELKRAFHPNDKNARKESMLPVFIPEESEKMNLITPVWKIQLVKESLKYMMTDEDTGMPANSDFDTSSPLPRGREFQSPGVTNFNMDSETDPSPTRSSPGKKSTVGPKQEPKSLVALVRPQDQLTHQEAIEYLKRIIDAQKRVGQPGDDVGAIFDKIQIWKQKQGDLDKQEKFVAQALKCKGLAVHNVKTALAKMDELKRDIKLTDDEITIIVYTSLDHGHLPNLLLLAGEFLKWFNLNFEGESTEERDFKDNKEEIWISTCIQASGIIKAYNGMSSNKEQILTQPWWEHQRYSNFGNLLAQRFKAKSHLMKQLRDMFKAQGDKLSYFDLFQFIELTLSIKLSKWEEDDLEGRLDRLGMAFIEFNEFNEFSQEYGIDWNEPLLENDLEDILDAKLNLSYKNYQLTEEDYFHGCPTMLTSEKAALAAVSQIYKQHKAKQKSGKGGKRFVDIDFGPKDANDEVGGAMAMYKTGEVPRKGYPKPANVAWVHADKICPPGKTVQFVDDGVASSDCVQGTLGDCWLISAMSVLATRDELLIGGRRGMELDPDMLVGPEIASLLSKGVYPPIFHRYRDIGLYVIRIFKDMQWVYVIVDDRIPISTVGDAKKKNKPVFGRCKDLNEIWVPVIEKAYAKLHGCYENLISGYVDEGIQELTGFQPEKILIRNEQSGLFPHKMIEQYYGGYKGFWDFLLARDNDGCLLGCSIKGYGKEGPQVIDGQPTGLILNHAYGINDIFEFDDNYNKGQKVRLLRLRNPWGNSEWKGAWSDDSPEVKKYRREIEKYIDSLPPDEQFELGADDGTFLMHYEDWHDNMSTLFLNVDFPEDYTGVRFASKWTKSNSGGLPGVNQQDVKERYATNPQFLIKPAYDTEVMLSLTQTGGRLPREPGQYFDYPFAETLHYAAVGVFKLNKGQSYLPAFDAKALKFMSPIKRERENSGRVILEAGSTYAIVCSTELAGKTGEFFLSVYFNQALRDVELKRAFHPNDKNARKESMLPVFIPEESEKMNLITPVWKIQLVKESLKYMMTDEDTGMPANSEF